MDYVIHPRIDLSQGFTLRRTLRLNFASGVPSDGISVPDGEPTFAGFGASLPVVAIDGVGEDYAGQLAANGVATLGDLVRINPLSSVEDIPMVRLREFRAKARLVLNLRVNLAPFAELAERDVSGMLRESPESLAVDAGDNRATSEDAARLQEQLAVLQIALDDAQLQQVTLGELAGA